ncbi:MAG TPA: hypothetical protein VLK33_16005, partial [Terriglobales bacterium]|nr:hypothetical protein [Terriglobales bacterium]
NSEPVQASLSTDGRTLYVIGHDLTTNVSSIHVVDTTTNADVNQIAITQGLCHAQPLSNQTFSCQPDLIAVRP